MTNPHSMNNFNARNTIEIDPILKAPTALAQSRFDGKVDQQS
jgi:hypothetical protein